VATFQAVCFTIAPRLIFHYTCPHRGPHSSRPTPCLCPECENIIFSRGLVPKQRHSPKTHARFICLCLRGHISVDPHALRQGNDHVCATGA
jgi:hypothetical protein